jgi:16S rRNA processing protein RimM
MDVIAIGRVGKPIGTRGEVKILPLTEHEERLRNLPAVWLGQNTADGELKKIRKVRIDSKHVVMSFYGIETVEDAGKIKDRYLFVPREDAVRLEEGSYFVDDVIGCEVVTEEQIVVGTVIDLFSLPMNDIWVVKKGVKEVFLPAVKAIIRQVDVEKKRITIHTLDGLLD